MAKLNLYIDKRPDKSGKHHIKISLSHNGTSALFLTGVFVKPEYWNKGDSETDPHIKKTLPGYKKLNETLSAVFDKIQEQILLLVQSGQINSFKTATQLKNYIEDLIYGRKAITFNEYFETCIAKYKRQSTASSFKTTLNRIIEFSGGRDLRFEDITVQWLDSFVSHMGDISTNAKAVYLRNIRAVFKSAVRNDITEAKDPFIKFRIKTEATAKRSLTIDQIRMLRDFECEKHQRIYRDMFMLIFYLRGINIVDLCGLTEIRNGRIEYVRAKTGRLYSVRVEPEAMELIERYPGKRFLLNILDRHSDYRQFRKQMNNNLRKIGPTTVLRYNKKERQPLFPEISSYWARHSVATIAANLDVPKETISAMLGHEIGSSITSIYIDFDEKKADQAMRKVIDAISG